jgi:peptidoglycan/LPS O-acetylase OafA/YrhL
VGGRGSASAWVERLSRRLSHPAWWLVPVIFLFVGEAAPEQVGKPSVLYAFVFLLGLLVVSDSKFPDSAERFRFPAFIAGIGLTAFWVVSTDFRDSLPDPSWGRAGLTFLGCAALWLMVIGAMGMGKRYLNRTSAAEKYLAEASYPIYIIHQIMVVIIAFYVVDFAIPEFVQWIILLALAVAATFALYEVARRVGVLRFLLGMRPRRQAAKPVEVALGPQVR